MISGIFREKCCGSLYFSTSFQRVLSHRFILILISVHNIVYHGIHAYNVPMVPNSTIATVQVIHKNRYTFFLLLIRC